MLFQAACLYPAHISGETQAGLFSAVTSGFVLNIQNAIQPDPNEETAALLRVLIYKMDNTTFGGQPPPLQAWSGPDHDIVVCQTVLYTSLGISLLAAFLAMLGKQWLNRFGKVEVRGSEIDESRNRQRKLSGMVSWRFDLVMESLPLMLQSALLLLGYALSRYLWTINLTVASVVIGITCIGLAFYVFIVIAGTIADNCPFQTPTSHILRSIYRLDNSRNRYISRARRAVLRLWIRTTRLSRITTLRLLLPLFTTLKTKRRSLVDLPQRKKAVRLFSKKETDHDAYNVDAGCIVWMIDTARGQTASRIISNFISEVVWHGDIKDSPSIPYLYDQVVDCFDFEEEKVSLVSRLRDQAFSTSKAFVHVYSQMRVTGAIDDSFVSRARAHHSQLADGQHKEDADLESTLWLVDYVMDRQREIDWSETKVSYSHRIWMSRTMLCLAWLKGGRLDGCLHAFVAQSLEWSNHSLSTDCILMLSLSLGIPIHADDLLVTDKRWAPFIKDRVLTGSDVYHRLAFETSVNNFFDRLEILPVGDVVGPFKVLPPMACTTVATRSYSLFHRLINFPSFGSEHEALKWEAARHALTLAFGKASYNPSLDDPTNILKFLVYHVARRRIRRGTGEKAGIEEVEVAELEKDHETAVRCAFAAFYGVDKDPAPVLVPEHSKHLLVELLPGIRRLLESDERSLPLRKAAIHFFYCVADNWLFGPNHLLASPQLIAEFTTTWAKNVVDMNRAYDTNTKAHLTFVLRMLRSKVWRPHLKIPEGQVALISELRILDFDLTETLNDPDVLPYLVAAENRDAIKGWLKASWRHWHVLDDPSRRALVDQTRATKAKHPEDLEGFEEAMGYKKEEIRRVIQRCKDFGESAKEKEGWMKELEKGLETLKGLKEETVVDADKQTLS